MKRKLLLMLIAFFLIPWIGNAQITTFPFSEDFEGTFLPNGWVKELGSSNNDITQSNSQNHTTGGTYSCRFSSFSSASDYNQYLFTDTIHVTSGYTQVTFWHRKYNTSAETLEWGISTTAQTSGAVSSWTAVTLSNTDWQETTVDLSAYVGSTIFFAWHYYGDYLYYVYLDDFAIEAPPACPSPITLTVSNVTPNTADLIWNSVSGSTGYNWEIVPSGGTPGTGAAVSSGSTTAGNDTTATATGLTGKTSYDAYVQNNCGSTWTGPVNFVTSGTCGVFQVDLIDSYGDGWNGGLLDVYVNGTLYYDSLTLTGGTGPESHFIPVDQGDILSFDYTAGSYSSENEYQVYDDGNNMVADEGSGGTTPADIGDPSIPSGLTACASCPDPTAQTETNFTTTGADLGWTDGTGSNWDLYIVPTGDPAPTQSTTPTVNDKSANPYTWAGGSAGTTYDWYVRSDCDHDNVGTSAWVGPSTFNTSCNVQTTLSESFETGSFPICWSQETNDDFDWTVHSGSTASGNTGPSAAYDGTYYLYTESSSPVANGDSAIVYTSSVDLAGFTSPRLNFWYHMYGAGMDPDGTIDVSISTDNGATYTSIWSKSGNQGNQWNQAFVYLSSYGTDIVIFKIKGIVSSTGTSYENDFAIDLFQVDEAPTCPAPTTQVEDSLNLDGAQLSWTENGSAVNWDIRIGTTGFDTTGTSFSSVTNDTITVDTLQASTTYDWYVRSSCGGGDYSDWLGPQSFTTTNGKATNPYPADGTDPVLVSSDTLKWSPVDHATKYVLNIGTTSGGSDVLANHALTDTAYITGNPWDYSTQYFWTVNTVYNGTSDTVTGTEWDFTTECGVYTPEYTQGFATYLPICWGEATGYLKNPTTLTGTTSYWSQDDFGNVVANGKSARLEIWGTTKKDWLISPSIDLSADSYQLEFDLALTHYSNTDSDTLGTDDTLAVVISTDNGATWNLSNALRIWTYPDYISNTGEHITIDLSSYSTTVKIGFYGSSTVSNKDNNVYIDNFKVRVPPACPEPMSLSQDSIKLNSVKLHWKENGSATTWNVRIGTAGFDTTGVAYYTVAADTFLTVDTLLASTSYDWYVRSSCGSGSYSVWVKSATSFTTLDGVATGPYPADGAAHVAVASDTLKWNPVDNATKYVLNIGTTSGGNDVLADYGLTDTVYIKGSSWDYATQYYWTVNTVYNGTSDTVTGTEWDFTTECSATSLPYFQDFDGVTAPDFPMCMTVENTNGDSYTWETNTTNHSSPNAAKISYNSNAAMNDWFFTRGLNLNGGVTYEVSFVYKAGSSGSYPEKLAVDWGDAANSANMSGTPIFDETNILGGWFTGSGTFTPATTGTYYVGFHGHSDADELTLYVDDIQVVQYQQTTTWSGNVDNDWRNENNWSNGIPPGTLTDVTIPSGKTNYPTVTKTAYCKSVTIESNASGDGSLIGAGNIISINDATVERYIPSDSVWHEVSAMTTGATIGSFYFNHSPDVWMEEYVEATDSRIPVFDLITNMSLGKGYEIWVDTGFIITASFNGTLNSADVALTATSSPPLSFTDAAHGYNLLGNPFSSAISWDSVYANGSPANIDNEVWVWSPASGNYKTYTGAGGPLTNGIIPMGQGFFIHASATSPVLTIPTSAQVHSSQAFYAPGRDSKPQLTLSVNKGQKNDEVLIAFNPAYTDNFDPGFDGLKLMGSKKAPQLYVVTEENKKLSIDAVPPVRLGDAKVIKLFFKAGETGDQVLIAQDIDKLEGVKVYLEDLKLGVTQLLNDKPVYNFFATYYQNPDRFRLHFERDVDGISSLSKQNNIRAYAYGKRLYIVSNENAAKATKLITLFDITGRKILEKQLPPGELVSVPVTVSNTYAVVRVVTNGEVYTTKVFIK